MTAARAFRLDGRSGWRSAETAGLVLGKPSLKLAPLPGSVRPLASADGSFGGLTLPTRVAPGPDGRLFVIDGQSTLLAYDPCLEAFAPLACLQGAVRRPGLTRPIALAVDPRGELLVLDGDSRSITAIAFDGRIRRRWGPFAPASESLRPVPITLGVDPLTGAPDGNVAAPPGAWDPVDLAWLSDGRILVSDRAAGRLRLFGRRGCPLASWDGATDDEPALAAPGALAVGLDGRIFVVEEGKAAIAILDAGGRIIERSEDSELLAGDFAAGSIAVDADGTLWISTRLGGPAEIVRRDCSGRCGRPERIRLTPPECALLAFDSEGQAILGSARSPCLQRADMTAYAAAGQYRSAAFDSGAIATQWDRIHLDLTVPQGTTLSIATFASDAPLADGEVAALGAGMWSTTLLTGDDGGRCVLAIRSGPGRYLWLRLDLAGDGGATPELRGATIGWPRRTSARYLPGTYSAEPAGADFLARFIGLFDQLREEMLAPIDALPALFDPMATPAAEAGASGEDFLDWLGGWIGIALDRGWSVERRRRLVAEAPKLFRIRGTVAGLKRHIAVYTGIEPKLIEHFRLRRWLTLDETRLDEEKLWGPEIVRRLQLDSYSEIGRFALVDGGDPLTDPVAAFAHRATVYVPVGESFGDVDRAAIEDVVEAAKPAHVTVDIRLMRPRFVIGCDLLLGVNTILGRDCRTARADESVLGEDIRLAGPPSGFTLSEGLRLGPDTTLE
ncbi:MAG TPA: phage tail protein [Allosphingosinicella sp.]